MMKGPIGKVHRSRVEPRGNVPICGWVHEQAGAPALPVVKRVIPTSQITGRNVLSLVSPKDEAPTLLMLGTNPPAALLDTLAEQSGTTRRVYVLMSSDLDLGGWADDPKNRQAFRLRGSNVLFHQAPEVPANAMLVGRGERGVLWLGRQGKEQWVLPLNNEQAQSLFEIFLHWFWSRSTHRAFSPAPLKFEKVPPQPFDTANPTNGPIQVLAPNVSLSSNGAHTLCLPHSLDSLSAARLILVGPSGHEHSTLKQLSSSGCLAVSNDAELPPFCLTSNGGHVSAFSSQIVLQVRLDDGQSQEFSALAHTAAQKACWRFHPASPLGELQHKEVWLAGAKAPELPAPEVDLPIAPAAVDTLKAAEDAEPLTWPKAPALALSVKYQWTILPPRAPQKTSDDKLVIQWQALDQQAKERLDLVAKSLDFTEKHASNVLKLLSTLVAPFLGYERSRTEQKKKLEGLKKSPPSSLGPTQAVQFFRELRALEREATALDKQQRDEEHKELERLREEDERTQWQVEKNDNSELLERKKTERTQLAAEETKLKSQLEKAAADLKAAPDGPEKKDLYATTKKAEDDLKELKKKLQALDAEIRQLDEKVHKPFQFTPAKQQSTASPHHSKEKGPLFVPPKDAAATEVIPGEALPAVGTLKLEGKQRFLIIKQWEDLPTGEAEATRLHARLVAPPEGT
ncbi:MAG: hypothetical protein IPK82_43075 [Polyangiaceae bacterium]|nr:hypothetical protein [Polyangiaceae bacterium]